MSKNWTPEDIDKAVDTLILGGVILYPTDTIWGIGGNATNKDTVRKLYDIKNRPLDKPFVVIVDSIEMLKTYALNIHPRVETLLEYHNRPLTIIYPQTTGFPDIVKASDGSVAIRVVRDQYCQELIAAAGFPLIATSANIADMPFPKSFGEISSSVIEGVDYVAKYKQNDSSIGEPSVIARYNVRGNLDIIRN